MVVGLGWGVALGCGKTSSPSAAAARSPPVAALEIPAGVLPPHGTLMIGDLHGTREIPAFVGQLVTAVAAREPVVLALEVPPEHVPAIQAYVASDGSAARRQEMLAEAWWQDEYQDGRRSVAMAELIETARAVRAAGRAVEVVGIDDPGQDAEAREGKMAEHVIAARRAHPDAVLIVYAGNLHTTRHERPAQPGFHWMAMRVMEAGIDLISLNARWSEGTTWMCQDAVPAHCGVKFLGGRPVESGIHLAPAPDAAYDGWIGVGTATASPPAAFPALAADIDAKIAAARSAAHQPGKQ
jgi:hypothetical protein